MCVQSSSLPLPPFPYLCQHGNARGVHVQGHPGAYAGGPAAGRVPLHQPGGALSCGHRAGHWGRHPHQGSPFVSTTSVWSTQQRIVHHIPTSDITSPPGTSYITPPPGTASLSGTPLPPSLNAAGDIPPQKRVFEVRLSFPLSCATWLRCPKCCVGQPGVEHSHIWATFSGVAARLLLPNAFPQQSTCLCQSSLSYSCPSNK